ncbi:indoleamine 2,3-dioxygenase 1-like [Pangshura tecta]
MEHEDKSESLQNLEEFHVSEEYGFVLPDPLTELPDYYAPWMNVAANLPHLIEGHRLLREVAKMPLLSTQYLRGHRQLRLARLALGFITMGYVWQGGGRQTAKILPRALAVPYCTISELLDLPPILVYADCVLANWKKRDPCGYVELRDHLCQTPRCFVYSGDTATLHPLEVMHLSSLRNLDILFSFPGGDSSKGFFLVSLLVEAAAAAGLKVPSPNEVAKGLTHSWTKCCLQTPLSLLYGNLAFCPPAKEAPGMEAQFDSPPMPVMVPAGEPDSRTAGSDLGHSTVSFLRKSDPCVLDTQECFSSVPSKAIPIIVNAILHHGLCSLETALQDVTLSICKMREAFKLIHECVNPEVFFRSLRIYLSGWKDNFLMPEGLVYEGVWDSPKQFFGGSAAQSSTLQCFDVLLGIQHSAAQGFSAEYLGCMRDYMPTAHRAFIQTLASGPSLRQFVLATGDAGLQAAFNKCVSALVDLRSYHIQIATKYITIPAGRCQAEQQQLRGCVHKGTSVLLERGTGGTGFVCFLRAIRDTTRKAQLTEQEATVPTH